MLTIISDLHLTDGSTGKAFDPNIFRDFCSEVLFQFKDCGGNELTLVLLGDVFDLIRTTKWENLESRPWDDCSDPSNKQFLEKAARLILKGITENPDNKAALAHIKALQAEIEGLGKVFSLHYLIGNHDWLVNMSPETRKMAATFLGIAPPKPRATGKFPEELLFENYSVFCRHGDMHDSMNYDGNRDQSSLGDAMVIEVMNRFPRLVQERLESVPIRDPLTIERLKDIDNIRPLSSVPAWLVWISKKGSSLKLGNYLEEVWGTLTKSFLELPFVKAHDRVLGFDNVDMLKLLTEVSISNASSIGEIAGPYMAIGCDPNIAGARKEQTVAAGDAKYVVYGHTHEPKAVFIGASKTDDDRLYFNSGTFRRVLIPSGEKNPDGFYEFHVNHTINFLTFFSDEEKSGSNYIVRNWVYDQRIAEEPTEGQS